MAHTIQFTPLQAIGIVAWAGISLLLFRLLLTAFSLWQYPGPWLAKFTNAWRVYEIMKKRQPWTYKALHEKYGKAVRVGPNHVDISDPVLIEPMFGLKADLRKSDMMKVWHAVKDGQIIEGLADTQDKAYHSQLRRPVANLYSMTHVQRSEPFIDSTIRHLLKRLDEEFVQKSCGCKIDKWLLYFAFDVMGEMNFSRRIGFLDNGGDMDGVLAALESEMAYRAKVGSMPWLDRCLKKNPLYLKLVHPTNHFAIRVAKLLGARKRENVDASRQDMYAGFKDAQLKHPDIVTDFTVFRYIMANIFAGSDTTALSMRSIVYHILKHPRVHHKLLEELDSANLNYPANFQVASTLPYLDAVIREGFRIHPIGAFSLERIVSESGFDLSDGRKLPPGTTVTMSPWTINFDKSVYGEDSKDFRPERWLRMEGEDQDTCDERVKAMKRSALTFGNGPRACIGRNIATLEIWKTIATFFGCLDVQLANPEREWRIECQFFANQTDMDITITGWRNNVIREKMLGSD